MAASFRARPQIACTRPRRCTPPDGAVHYAPAAHDALVVIDDSLSVDDGSRPHFADLDALLAPGGLLKVHLWPDPPHQPDLVELRPGAGEGASTNSDLERSWCFLAREPLPDLLCETGGLGRGLEAVIFPKTGDDVPKGHPGGPGRKAHLFEIVERRIQLLLRNPEDR